VNQPIRIAFPGGSATLQKPTRDALLQSAKQWTTAARERAHEAIAAGTTEGKDMTYIIGALGNVLRILEEAGK